MSDQEDQGDDIKDLEFRLTHDLNQLQVRWMRNVPVSANVTQ